MIPEHCTALASPDGADFAVQTRPLIVAQVEPRGLIGLRLHAWRSDADLVAEETLHKSMERLALLYAKEIDQLPGLPSKWDYVFGILQLPEFLLCDSIQNGFTGILRLKAPALWVILDEEEEVKGCVDLEGAPASDTEAIQEALDWYKTFIEQEDQLS